ncbi:Wzz/FepE/Etk N-terminal domain-containing protein [Mesorhizobium sp. WSM2239]|uniref:Wzz/FepE/Etk N-terminal domain-containing protein n=2 Tax=unclassified Mesorhizobium TaxID=325217 RepID=A0AAU8D8M8_9HYPH
MFDTDQRDDPRRERSLLSFGDPRPGEEVSRRSGSLLAAAEPPRSDNAAARHQVARQKREMWSDPPQQRLENAPAIDQKPAPLAEPASAKTGRIGRLLPDWIRRPLQAESDEPRPAWDAPVGRREHSRVDISKVEIAEPAADRDVPDEHWKPLIDPGKVVAGIAKSKWIIVGTTLLGAILGVMIALSTPKKYEATAELLVDPRDLNLVERDITQSGLSNEATLAIIENQVRILTSGTVLIKVVDRLNLASDPEFNGEGSDGGIGAFISNLRSLLSRSDGDGAGDRRHTLAVQNLSEALTVERGGKTFVIMISAVTRDGEKSALIANTMTDVFLQTYGQIQSNTAGRAEEELTSRLDQLRAGVEAAERKVETFKAENDIIDAQGRLITDDEIVKLNEQLSVARARTLELNARAASTRSVNVDAVLGGTLPEELTSPTIQELRAQYSALKSDADRMAVRLGPRHPERMAVEAQLAGARDMINSELRRIVSSTQTELKRAVQLEQELASRLAQLKVRQGDLSNELVTLRELEREASAKRAVYEAFLLRARETGEQKDINTANMSVISKAWPPLNANPPSRSTMALTGLMLGFFAGVGFGGMRGAYESLSETASSRSARQKPRRRDPSSPITPAKGPEGTGSSLPADQETGYRAVRPETSSQQAAPADVAPEAQPEPQSAPRRHETSERSRGSSMQDPVYAYPPFGAPHPASAPAVYPMQPQAYPQPYPPAQPQPVYGQPQMQQPYYADPNAPATHYAPQVAYPPAPLQQPQHWQQPQMPPQSYYPYAQQGQQPAGFYPAHMPPQTLYPQHAAVQPYASHAAAPAAPFRQPEAPPPPVETQQAPIDEIRSSLREFREAVRDFTEARQRRRYF